VQQCLICVFNLLTPLLYLPKRIRFWDSVSNHISSSKAKSNIFRQMCDMPTVYAKVEEKRERIVGGCGEVLQKHFERAEQGRDCVTIVSIHVSSKAFVALPSFTLAVLES
jgi:hypothetical protein